VEVICRLYGNWLTFKQNE
jgi:hypothetical protein